MTGVDYQNGYRDGRHDERERTRRVLRGVRSCIAPGTIGTRLGEILAEHMRDTLVALQDQLDREVSK